MSVATISTVVGARPLVQLGVGDTRIPTGQAVWDVARWDTAGAEWASNEPTWLDITCDVHDVEIDAGRDRSISRWQVGTASITVDNRDGTYDVNAPPASPWVLSVRPGRQLRVGMALDGGEPNWLGRWFIDTATPKYDPASQDVVELGCVDAKGQVGKVDLAVVADPGVGAGELVSTRIHRVLDAVSHLPAYRAVDPGAARLQATMFGQQVVDLLDIAADSAGGVIFGDGEARIVYRDRDWNVYDPRDPVDSTIGNLPADHITDAADHVTFGGDHLVWLPGVVCPSGWEMSFDSGDMATRVLVGRQGEIPHQFDDIDNQVLYGLETFSRTDLICDNIADVDDLGSRMLRILSADFLPNIAAVTVDAATSTAARNLAATVNPTLPSRYRCYLEQGGRIVFDRQFQATGISHRIDPNGWTVRIALDDAGPFATIGERWDDAAWSSGTWAGPAATTLPALVGASHG